VRTNHNNNKISINSAHREKEKAKKDSKVSIKCEIKKHVNFKEEKNHRQKNNNNLKIKLC
jgi:hypothetical protein